MFDAAGRIVVCNQQYLRMYKLSPEVVKPGCTLLALMEHRKQTGFLTRDPHQYVKEIMDSIAAGKTSKWLIEASDGRKVHAINEPMPGGGWVSTHEDVTEQLRLQQQHDFMAEQQKRRGFIDAVIAAFRSEMETLLKTFGDSAAAMKSTAVVLSSASNHNSLCADGAVAASNEATKGVNTAAIATDELSSSIGEIARQITQTNNVVYMAVEGSAKHQRRDDDARGIRAENRRYRQAYSDHCRADQSACAQCHDRSGTRGRSRPRLCRRRL